MVFVSGALRRSHTKIHAIMDDVKTTIILETKRVEEAFVDKQYVEARDQGYWIAGSRVSLESVIYAFLDGLAPETIAAECFPVLSLEQVYGAIAYYLSNRQEIDVYLRQMNAEFEAFHLNFA